MFHELGFGLCIWDILSIIIVITMIGVLIVNRINDSKRDQKLKNCLKKSDSLKS